MIFICAACRGGTIASPSDAGAQTADAHPTVDGKAQPVDLGLPGSSDANPIASADLTSSGPTDLGSLAIGPYTLTFNLDAGAFPYQTGQPSALVYVPTGFSLTPPVDLVVYIHGHSNCVENVVKETGGPCSPSGPIRGASNLLGQLENSKRNALLILPEVKFELASGDPGKLGAQNGLKNFLDELLPKLAPQVGALQLSDVGDILLFSHSGGYWAAAKMATLGGVSTQEVHLLDSLYGYESTFQEWIAQNPATHEAVPPLRRFFSVYTAGGGTDDNNIAMATGAQSWSWLAAGARLYDDGTSTWTDDQFLHGVMWKRSALSHSGVTLYYFQKLLETSPLLVDKP